MEGVDADQGWDFLDFRESEQQVVLAVLGVKGDRLGDYEKWGVFVVGLTDGQLAHAVTVDRPAGRMAIRAASTDEGHPRHCSCRYYSPQREL